LATVGLFLAGLPRLAALTPLGAVYMIGTPQADWVANYGLGAEQLSTIVLAQIAVCFALAYMLTRKTLERFDLDIRESQWNQVGAA
jgi:hypothetical protein